MSRLLIKYVQNKSEGESREAFSLLSGWSGIICNLILCAFKFILGAFTGAVSITADAVNNLTDAGVNTVTIVGAKLASKPVDKEHPFGHGRAEYISALIVAFSIFVMSFELGKSAVAKIIHPETVKFSASYLIVLVFAVAVKLWMAYFNRKLYHLTNNLNMKVVVKDSLNDCIATSSTAAALILAGKFNIPMIDGIVGFAVAVFVFFSGFFVVKDILSPLLGEPPSKELTDKIESIILSDDIILGVHDLIVHNYGAGRSIASAHAEVASNLDLITVHNAIDRVEREITETLGIDICIHTDPIEDDAEYSNIKTLTEIILSDYNPDFTFHDLRITEDDETKTLSFDLVTPFDYEGKESEIEGALTEIYHSKLPDLKLNINIEHSYT